MAMHKILIPLDGSDFSRQILPYVREFFSPVDNEIVLLRVAPHPAESVGLPPLPVSPDMAMAPLDIQREAALAADPAHIREEMERLRTAMLSELQTEAQPLENAGYAVSVYTRFGEPSHEIVAFVESEKIQLVAMTTHGRSGFGRLIFGSVAEWVMRHVSVPVMVLRPSEEKARAASPDETA